MLQDLIDAIMNHDRSPEVKASKKDEIEDRKHLKFIEMSAYENDLYAKGIQFIAGIDEVGRGPLAGPVVAAAVILPPKFYLPGLDDSKKLSKKKREEYYDIIIKEAVSYSIGQAEVEEIDAFNIYECAKRAMIRAVNGLSVTPHHLLIDAMKLSCEIPQTSIIKGDAKSISIAAASIVAKVTRDRLMEALDQQYPMYGFKTNSGYGTKAHLEAIEAYGILPVHRKTFEPIRSKIATKTTLFDF